MQYRASRSTYCATPLHFNSCEFSLLSSATLPFPRSPPHPHYSTGASSVISTSHPSRTTSNPWLPQAQPPSHPLITHHNSTSHFHPSIPTSCPNFTSPSPALPPPSLPPPPTTLPHHAALPTLPLAPLNAHYGLPIAPN